MTTAQVLRGNALALPLADDSVDLIVTSPPYFALRSYQDNGVHYDGQIGSEATPAEFVDALLEATRECIRVLKPSGSLWVNLGDRYSPGEPLSREGMTIEDAAWLAGVIDSDGSVSIHINKQPEGRAPSFVPWVRVGQMRPEVVEQIAAVTGIGRVMQDGRGVWNWCASAQQAATVLRDIWPWLHIKQRQALAAVEVARHIAERKNKGAHSRVEPVDIAYRQMIRDSVIAWNAGQVDDWQPPRLPLPNLPARRTWLQQKSLSGIPWRYALACIDDLGLILRAEVIWSKPNGLPESVTDRVRRSHETWFHFTLSPRYFSAVDEIREPYTQRSVDQAGIDARAGLTAGTAGRKNRAGITGRQRSVATINPLGALPGSVWSIPTEPLTVPDHLGVDHFAAFPTEWPKRIIQAWSPAGVCTACGEGRRPVADRSTIDAGSAHGRETLGSLTAVPGQTDGRNGARLSMVATITGYACACPTPDAPTRPAVVADVFGGTGTTAMVAAALGRTGITIDMSADYCRLAVWRTRDRNQTAKILGIAKAPPVHPDEQALF